MIKQTLKNGWFWAVLAIGIVFAGNYHRQAGLIENKSVSDKNLSLCSAAIKPAENALSLQNSFRDIAELAKDAVVSISTVHVENYEYFSPYEFFFGDPFQEFQGGQKPRQMQKRYEGMGSGVVIDEKGLILTNDHVVRGADEIKIHIASKTKPLTGEVIGRDARTDLAVVKIREKGKYHSLALADSTSIRVGDWAIAIGSPFGLEHTVTVGVISAVRQSLNIEGQNYRDLIQTDAAINRGNSGGPLLNIQGEVIGINTAIYAPTGVFSGIGFAIPINRAKDILNDLIQKGKVVRGWLGVEIKNVDEVIAGQFGLEKSYGALVNDVFGNSPADKAGIKRGDIILQFDNKEVKDVAALQDAVSATAPKKKVKVQILRNKKIITLDLVAGEMPSENEAAKAEDKESDNLSKQWLGMKASNINPSIAKRYNLSTKETGVVVVELDQSKEAAAAGLAEGDVIKAINQNEVIDVASFDKIAKSVDPSKGVVFDIIREGRPLYISFMLEK